LIFALLQLANALYLAGDHKWYWKRLQIWKRRFLTSFGIDNSVYVWI